MEEMNEFETKPRGTFWRDWGVYGALALCLAIIGAAVALTSLPEKEEAQEAPPENLTAAAPRQQEALPELELDFPRHPAHGYRRARPQSGCGSYGGSCQEYKRQGPGSRVRSGDLGLRRR